MADNYLSKSWLFEIVNTQTNTIETSFTLVLPPQSYSIKEKHRVSITKTFGNAFIDDYGPDNLEITIKGISGTSHVFPTFRTRGPSGSLADVSPAINSVVKVPQFDSLEQAQRGAEGYDGKGAFYTFRNDIMRYKDAGDFDKKELRVYDLSDEQSYKCALLEFSLDRTSDKPFHYPFTISLFVYARLSSKAAAISKIVRVAKNPVVELERIEDTADKATNLFQDFKTFTSQIAKVKQEATALKSKVNSYLIQSQEFVETPLTAIKYLASISIDTMSFVGDLWTAGKMTVDRYANAGEMVESMLRSAVAVYGYAVTEGSQIEKTEVIEGDDDLDLSEEGVVAKAATDDAYTFDSISVHTVTGGQTLQDIALSELGDSELWKYIAAVNDITSNVDIQPGDTLYIPFKAGSGDTDMSSFIITENTYGDPYGTDIRLDENGRMVLYESGDTSLITGLENLMQAVNTRMMTLQGSLVKQSALGLAASAGLAGTALSLSYLRMSIVNSLISDPRIQNVKNVRLRMNNSEIHASMDITPTGYTLTLPVEAVI